MAEQRDLTDLYEDLGGDPPDCTRVQIDLIEDTPAPVDAALKRSMSERGQLVPVILNAPEGGGKFTIIDGRRRVAAARAIGLTDLSAEVHQVDSLVEAALTATANAVRSDNPENELEAIEVLANAHYTDSQISQATGMTVATIRKRKRLLVLPEDVRAAIREGRLAIGVAEKLASLSPAIREKAIAFWREHGKLTLADLRELSQVDRQEAIAELDDDVFGDGDDDPDPATIFRLAINGAMATLSQRDLDAILAEYGYTRKRERKAKDDVGNGDENGRGGWEQRSATG